MAQLTTFVFTDLVGSVALKQRMPGVDADARDAAYVQHVLLPHRERIEAGLAEAGGRVVSTAGDGHFVVFTETAKAARWAIEVVRSHEAEPISADGGSPAQVRIGMHAGMPQPDPADPDNFIGRAVDFAARLSDQAQGGQILVSRTTASLIEDGLLDGVWLHSHGAQDLRGIGETELYEVLYAGRTATSPRQQKAKQDRRAWSVLPRTMGLTEYTAQSNRGSSSRDSRTELAAPPTSTSRPRRVGNYELGELIGSGGMGNVYKARHAQFNRPRAVKIIRPDLVESGGDSVVQRFYQEVRATGELEHPNLVVAIDSSSPTDDEHFLVMEYVDGVSIDRLLEVEGRLPVAEACEIARQAALGLEHLHEGGLVHRDVKPSNLMVALTSSPHLPADRSSGSRRSSTATAKLPVVKLMDLGLALLVRGDEERVTKFDRGGMGTGYYMSPEQWKTTSVDIRADIYSLGCTLYHLLTGEPPFAYSDLKPERAHATTPPPRLEDDIDAPAELSELVRSMLAKRPADRPQTPAEVAAALEPFVADSRLGERVTEIKLKGLVDRGLGRAETRAAPDGAASVDTRPPALIKQQHSTFVGGRRFPWLLTAVTTVVACGAILAMSAARSQMLSTHRDSLIQTAGFAADKMRSAIDSRVEIVTRAAEDDQLVGWLKEIEASASSADSPPLEATQELQRWLVAQRDREEENYPTSSWFITDARGKQLARSPKTSSIGKSYDHRPYFHGKSPDFEADRSNPVPLQEAHQSAVYESTSRRGELKVAFSAPIFEGSRVIGVLAQSVVLGDFHELDKSDEIAEETEILLVDIGSDMIDGEIKNGLVLHHRELRAGVRLSEEILQNIGDSSKQQRARMLPPYPDVLGRRSDLYWGATASVRPEKLPRESNSTWVVIAQEPRP